MKTIPLKLQNYQILDCLHTGSKTLVYRATQISDNQSVILKILRNEYPSFNELLRFRNQYTITKNLNIPGIVSPYRLESYKNGYILVMPYWGGISLQDYIQEHPLTLIEILNITIQIADILQHLHQARVIHKDIKPANILIHPQSKHIWLIDFSIASLLPKESQEIQNPNILEGTLAYIAPEQTGRMNRGIDYRADFYSLGVTLYELLTGKLPFESDDVMEIVHCHIAKVPTFPNIQYPQESVVTLNLTSVQESGDTSNTPQPTPHTLKEIVLKLMAKNAEDRYQSALGLKYDLEQCLIQWKETGNITTFQLGKRDLSDRFLIPEKLYGRGSEVQALLDAFERVSSDSPEKQNKQQSEIMLVAGSSGVGKTAVINEVHKPITRQQGYFIKGKFDQFNRNIPFSAFVQAFRSLMGQLLSESDAELGIWKANILEALGENGQVLIDVIPELEYIIEQQPPAPELSGTAAQNRFNLLFQKFVRVFTTKEHPLVIFLDDLQWADSASLNLLKLLTSESETGYLLVLGAYRDNEVFPAHPLILILDEITQQQVNIQTLTLKPLSLEDINHLVADTLLCSTEIAKPLSQLVYQKTQGNPFFTTQFLKGLHEDGYISFNSKLRYWQCEMATVRQLALTDDVVQYMVGRLQKLSTETQNVLKLAGAIGNQFDLKTLAVVCELNQDEVAVNLWSALQEGFVIPESETYKFFQGNPSEEKDVTTLSVRYRFLHDRVQQAAYGLIPQHQKSIYHLSIGRRLLKEISPQQQQDHLFDIVSQLNMGKVLMTDTAERETLAQLNLDAGKKAIHSTAYAAARNFLQIGLELLRVDCWQTQYKLTLNLHLAAAEAAYLNADFEGMEQIATQTLQSAKTLLDKVKIYEIQINALTTKSQMLEAIAVGENILTQLGVEFSSQPNEALTTKALDALAIQLKDKQIEEFVSLPAMTDARIIAAMRLLAMLFAPIFLACPGLLPLHCSTMVNLSLQFGNSSASTIGYVGYGMVLSTFLAKVETGYGFGQVALKLLNQLNGQEYKSLTLLLFIAFIQHRQDALKAETAMAKEGYLAGIETGNFLYAGYNMSNYFHHKFFAGFPLDDWDTEIENYCVFLTQVKQDSALIYLRIQQQVVQNLKEVTAQPDVLSGVAYDETVMLNQHFQTNELTAIARVYINKLMLAYLFKNYNNALDSMTQADSYLGAVVGTIHTPVFHFYAALTYLALLSEPSENEQVNLLSFVTKHQVALESWADYAPMNHQHKIDLIKAEICRFKGQKAEGIELYERAIQGAKANDYLHEEALANELAAQFYLSWEKDKIAQTYMMEAYYCYSRWGAKAKVIQLEQQYPQLLSPVLQQQTTHLDTFQTITSQTVTNTSTQASYQATSSTSTNLLDLTSVMKASQALSGEIELEKLVTQLMQVILENAGATKGVLIFNRDKDLTVKAIAIQSLESDENINIIQQKLLIEDCSEVPLKLINWVKRQLKPLVIDDILNQTEWASDQYLIKQKPQSLLCLPILNQGKLLAILYLENTLMTQAFTPERMEILNLLCSQAAISLENAALYQKAQEYSQQLEQSLTQLQEAQVQLVQSEKMSALGQMMSGITHEINNPLGFISGNINQAEEAFKDVLEHLEVYQQNHPPGEAVNAHAEEIELEYLLEDLPEMVSSMKTGIDRIQEISKSMRIFSRADQEKTIEFDLHEALDSTLLILKHRLKASEKRPEIQVIKEYGDFANIQGFPGQLNQVFMNILANAIDMFDEMSQKQSIDEIKQNPYQITLKTELNSVSQTVNIQIQDNGCGMSDDVKAKVFEHLFTTKAVGKGTGLGLSIARQIVVDKHRGTLNCYSEIGEGTAFMIQIPA